MVHIGTKHFLSRIVSSTLGFVGLLFAFFLSTQATACLNEMSDLIETPMESAADVVRLLVPKGEWPRELNRYSDDEPIPHDSKIFIVHVHQKGIVEEIAMGWAKKEDAPRLQGLAIEVITEQDEPEIPPTPLDVPQTQIVDGLLFHTVYKGRSWYYTDKLIPFFPDDPVPDDEDVEFFFILEYKGESFPVFDEETLRITGFRPELKVERTFTAWTQDKKTIEILKRDHSSPFDMTVDEKYRTLVDWHWTLTNEAKAPLGDPSRSKILPTYGVTVDLYEYPYEPAIPPMPQQTETRRPLRNGVMIDLDNSPDEPVIPPMDPETETRRPLRKRRPQQTPPKKEKPKKPVPPKKDRLVRMRTVYGTVVVAPESQAKRLR